MGEGCDRFRLAVEAFQKLGVVEELARQQLDCNLTFHARVTRQEHGSHTRAPDLFDDLITSYFLDLHDHSIEKK